jgi:hypothetical protein
MVQHLSMRVPWRDQPWDHRVCAHPAAKLVIGSDPAVGARRLAKKA